MLELHLDEDAELASRPHAFIERSAEWIKSRFQIGANTVVFDYGCGPGLYTSRFARMGANVTGIDFSHRSIDHATEYATEHGLEVKYVLEDFVTTHDDFEQELAASLGQLLHAKVVDDQQIGLEVSRHDSVVAIGCC